MDVILLCVNDVERYTHSRPFGSWNTISTRVTLYNVTGIIIIITMKLYITVCDTNVSYYSTVQYVPLRSKLVDVKFFDDVIL